MRWFGHLERKGVDDWVSACRNFDGGRGEMCPGAERLRESV